ncbi:MAG: ATPase [Cytophagales bacterium]|nr:MAG: ATPase [Cytophagales bacterium]
MTEVHTLNTVLNHLKTQFVGKDELIDLLGISLVAGENMFLLGPPGTAKSAIVRSLSASIEGGRNFDYLLTRFTEPNELFGPFDIRRLREGELVTNTEGMLPEASLVFLDEIFNANSAILNSLLMALNERVFRRGKETRSLPALMFVSASNSLPDDPALNALLDRFLIRVRCDYVEPDRLGEVLLAGWQLNANTHSTPADRPTVGPDALKLLQQQCRTVDLADVRKPLIELVHTLRNTGISVSDRRAVKIQNLLAASAILSGRTVAVTSDLWVLKYIWDTEEQVEVLAGIVDAVIEKDPDPQTHPRALAHQRPNADELLADVLALRTRWQSDVLPLAEQSVVKDKLRYLQTRAVWLANADHKGHIQTEIDDLWHTILQTL